MEPDGLEPTTPALQNHCCGVKLKRMGSIFLSPEAAMFTLFFHVATLLSGKRLNKGIQERFGERPCEQCPIFRSGNRLKAE